MLTSTYDNLDRLLTRELGGTGVTPMKAAWDYDAIGDLETVTRSGKSGGSWVVAGVTTYAHDDLGRTTNIRLADVGDKTISEYGYTFDDADRITGMSVNGVSRTFGYDDTNQITNDNGTARTYDANGNRTGGSYATDDANRMTTDGTWTYTYDDAGQATGKSKSGVAWTYEYDHRGQLVEASDGTTTVTYSYDAFGNRIGRVEDDGTTVTEERYVVDGWDTAKPGAVGTENFDIVMDLDDEDDIVARRLFGPSFDDLIGGQDGGGTVRWYDTDHLGSVRKVFDNLGTVTNTVVYDAFGGFLGGVPVDRYAYTGREWDATTGLTHYRAREKDGHRFLSEDPNGFGAGDANLARYVGNGGVNRRDPSGQYWIVDNKYVWWKFESFLQDNDIRFGWIDVNGDKYLWIDDKDRAKLEKALLQHHDRKTVDVMLDAIFDNRETHQMYTSGDPRGVINWRNEVEAAPESAREFMRNENRKNGVDRTTREKYLKAALSGKTECQTLKGDPIVDGLTLTDPALKHIRDKEGISTVAAASMLIGARSLLDLGITALQEVTGVPFIPTKVGPKLQKNSAAEIAKGAARAEGRSWQTASLDKAIEKHAGPNHSTWKTTTGKQIYENPVTGRQVVVDIEGGYFRIFQPKTIGGKDGAYLNLIGIEVRPSRFMKDGSAGSPLLRDVDKGLWQQETHFFIERCK